MISIVNVGPNDDPNPLGERDYEVRINRRVIATFKHRRSEGISACMEKATEAVKNYHRLEEEEFISNLSAWVQGGDPLSDPRESSGVSVPETFTGG